MNVQRIRRLAALCALALLAPAAVFSQNLTRPLADRSLADLSAASIAYRESLARLLELHQQAVHPDSVEGQALMNYLRGAGISFIAIRARIPGSATGAHIHIGLPSKRTVLL